jgi:hypothetical protein
VGSGSYVFLRSQELGLQSNLLHTLYVGIRSKKFAPQNNHDRHRTDQRSARRGTLTFAFFDSSTGERSTTHAMTRADRRPGPGTRRLPSDRVIYLLSGLSRAGCCGSREATALPIPSSEAVICSPNSTS